MYGVSIFEVEQAYTRHEDNGRQRPSGLDMTDSTSLRLRTILGEVVQQSEVKKGIKHMNINGGKLDADHQAAECMPPVLSVRERQRQRLVMHFGPACAK